LEDINLWQSMITSVFALLGVLIGGLVTYLVQTKSKEKEHRALCKSLSLAIAAEIEAYLDLILIRDHTKYAKTIIELNKNGIKTLPKDWVSGFERGIESFPVITANLSNIGSLGSSCSDVVAFYSQAMAVRLTLMGVSDGKYDEATATDLERMFQGELELWGKTEYLGRNVIKSLRR